MTHICVSKLTSIGPDSGLLPDGCQAIIWINAGILLIRTLGTNFSDILSEIHLFSFQKMHFKILSAKCRPFCLGLTAIYGNIKMITKTSDNRPQAISPKIPQPTTNEISFNSLKITFQANFSDWRLMYLCEIAFRFHLTLVVVIQHCLRWWQFYLGFDYL